MASKKYADLFPNIISDKLLWDEFFECIDDIELEEMEAPLQELVKIRNVSRLSDEDIITLTTRMMGFNVNKESVQPIKDNLANAMPMLGMFHEIDGLETFYKFVEFITGRQIDIEYLYTNDYADFYPEPHGPLLIDGGDWYKTTHINLWIGSLSQDRRSALRDYSHYIKKLLGTFYEYAPANLVVHGMGILIRAEASLYINGTAGVLPVDYHTYDGRGSLDSMQILGPTTVTEGTKHQYYIQLNWSSGFSVKEFAQDWHSSKLRVAQISRTGYAGFGLTPIDEVVQLEVNYLGMSADLHVTVVGIGAERELEYMTLFGQKQVDGGLSANYIATAHYSDGSEDTIVPSWSLLSPYGNIDLDGNLLTTPVGSDKPVYVQATVVSRAGVEVTAVKQVAVLSLEEGVYLTGLDINGPVSIFEDTEQTLTATAHYSDTSSEQVIVKWSLSVKDDFISLNAKGILSVGTLDAEFLVTASAIYTYRGKTLVGNHVVTVKPTIRTVVQLFITGQSIVKEGDTEQFSAVAQWNDGAVSKVIPEWGTSKYTISEEGDFLAYGVRIAEPVVVYAKHTDATGNLSVVSRTITVVKHELEADFVTIQGPHSLAEGSVGIYEARVTWNDGSVTRLTGVDWSLSDTSFAFMSSSGELTFSNPTSTTITISASYSSGGVILQAEKTTILIPQAVITTDLILSGPSSVYEDSQSQFTATVILDDGSSLSVQPVWGADVVYPNINSDASEDDIVADISTYGLLHARRVEEDTQVSVTAKYFKETAFMTITVLNKPEDNPNTVSNHRIDGPSVVPVDGVGSYAQMVTFLDRNTELAVSSDWSIDVPKTVAEISPDGYLLPRSNVNATITITSIYQCSTTDLVDTKVIQLLGDGTSAELVRIEGLSSLKAGDEAQYEAIRVNSDNSEINISGSVSWSVLSADGVGIDTLGKVYVPSDINSVVNFTILAETNEGFASIRASKIVTVSQVLPVNGTGPIGILDDAAISAHIQIEGTRSSGESFTSDVGPGEYLYFAHPVDLGIAQFTDVVSGFHVGMDGASWPINGGIGTTSGPVTIARDNGDGTTSDWYLHRSDFGGIGEITLLVNYI